MRRTKRLGTFFLSSQQDQLKPTSPATARLLILHVAILAACHSCSPLSDRRSSETVLLILGAPGTIIVNQ
ncbi:hypothetical protein BJX96DRAFT_109785 [Aspergillus floccosus]